MDQLEYYGIKASSVEDAFVIAATLGLTNEMRLMLNDGLDPNSVASYCNSPALCRAAGAGQVESLRLLIANGADLELTDWNEMTPLMNACCLPDERGVAVATELLSSGALVNTIRTCDWMNALKFACSNKSPEVVRLLLRFRAIVEDSPESPQSALMLAARAGDLASIRQLIEAGADVGRQCGLQWAKGMTARQLAEMEGQTEAAELLKMFEGG